MILDADYKVIPSWYRRAKTHRAG